MALGLHFSHQRGKMVSDPADKEKSGLHVIARKDLEHTASVLFDARRPAIPGVHPDVISEGFNLEIVFDVHAKDVITIP